MSRRGQHRGRDLVQQRLELVVVVLVDERDVDVVVLRERAGAGDAREPAADDDHAVVGLAVPASSSSSSVRRSCAAVRRRRLGGRLDVDPAAPEGVEAAPAARDVEQLEMADRRGQRRVDDRWSPIGSSPSIVRSRSSGAPVDHACGLQAVGYWTGYLVTSRS